MPFMSLKAKACHRRQHQRINGRPMTEPIIHPRVRVAIFSQDKVDARAGFDNQMAKAALEASDMKEACAVAVAQVCV